MTAPFDWDREPRSSFELDNSRGVYALFLRGGSSLKLALRAHGGLLYIGKADGQGGFLRRCHFGGRTTNHSPRKSLAVLLIGDLALKPILKLKPNSAATWGLDAESDQRLTEWMHQHLELAIEVNKRPDHLETELVGLHAPPLNLSKCLQTEHHRMISAKRASVLKELMSTYAADQITAPDAEPRIAVPSYLTQRKRPAQSTGKRVGPNMITAVALAAEFGIDPKRLRQALRDSIKSHQKHQPWVAQKGSRQHVEMYEVAKRLSQSRTGHR